MELADTTSEARGHQLAVFAAMSGSERVMLAVEMAEDAKSIAIEGIRHRNPKLDDEGVHLAWLALLFGEEFARQLTNADSSCR